MGEVKCIYQCPNCKEELDGRDLKQSSVNLKKETVEIVCWRCGGVEELELLLALDLEVSY